MVQESENGLIPPGWGGASQQINIVCPNKVEDVFRQLWGSGKSQAIANIRCQIVLSGLARHTAIQRLAEAPKQEASMASFTPDIMIRRMRQALCS